MPIAPRPKLLPEPRPRQAGRDEGHAPVEKERTPASPYDPHQDLAADVAVVTTPALGLAATPLANTTIAPPLPSEPVVSFSGIRTASRGPKPITPNNLDPAALELQIEFVGPFFTTNFNNAIINPRYPQSFINPKHLSWIGQAFDLHPSEIRWIFTPRGRVRCTRAVVIYFRFPQFQYPLELSNARVLVLPDDHPDPEVPLIIGHPWIQAHKHLAAYVPATFLPGNTAEYHLNVPAIDLAKHHMPEESRPGE